MMPERSITRGGGIPRRRLCHHAIRRHILGEPDIAADRRALTDRDAAEDGGAGVNDHVILDDRVSGVALDQVALIVGREMPRAERDRLINSHIVADDGGFADDDAGAVIDKKPDPIVAPGWISMPVLAWAISAISRAISRAFWRCRRWARRWWMIAVMPG
jgi:hypothetical protein